MNLKDIIQQFAPLKEQDFLSQPLLDNLSKELVIQTQGLSGSCVKVKSFWPGFDWYNGRIVITPEQPLLNYDIRKLSKLKELYLREISGVSKTSQFNYLAFYKKKNKTFENKLDGQKWIREKLKEELEDN